MWKLYLDFESELKSNEAFDPMSDIFNAAGPIQTPAAGTACIVPIGTHVERSDIFAFIESERLSSSFTATRRFVVAGNGPQYEPLVRSETLTQGWGHQKAPVPETAPEREPEARKRRK